MKDPEETSAAKQAQDSIKEAGTVSDDVLARARKIIDLENSDAKEDAQRHMAWWALSGMLTYPIMIMTAEAFKMGAAATVLGAMAPTYFVSVAGIIAAFYVKEGIIKAKTMLGRSDQS